MLRFIEEIVPFDGVGPPKSGLLNRTTIRLG